MTDSTVILIHSAAALACAAIGFLLRNVQIAVVRFHARKQGREEGRRIAENAIAARLAQARAELESLPARECDHPAWSAGPAHGLHCEHCGISYSDLASERPLTPALVFEHGTAEVRREPASGIGKLIPPVVTTRAVPDAADPFAGDFH